MEDDTVQSRDTKSYNRSVLLIRTTTGRMIVHLKNRNISPHGSRHILNFTIWIHCEMNQKVNQTLSKEENQTLSVPVVKKRNTALSCYCSSRLGVERENMIHLQQRNTQMLRCSYIFFGGYRWFRKKTTGWILLRLHTETSFTWKYQWTETKVIHKSLSLFYFLFFFLCHWFTKVAVSEKEASIKTGS